MTGMSLEVHIIVTTAMSLEVHIMHCFSLIFPFFFVSSHWEAYLEMPVPNNADKIK